MKIGCSGWYYQEWINVLYPESAKPKEFFSTYISFFNTVEVNSTFYHIPRKATLEQWYRQAPTNFRYIIKANRLITHYDKTLQTQGLIKSFYDFKYILKEKLDGFLFQFPHHFIFNRKNLDFILRSLNPVYHNIVEFRHPSWWNYEVFKFLEEMRIFFCSPVGLNMPSDEDVFCINQHCYLRFHGDAHYAHDYSKQELVKWKTVIEEKKIKKLWVYFNNNKYACAPQNALSFKNLMKQGSSGETD